MRDLREFLARLFFSLAQKLDPSIPGTITVAGVTTRSVFVRPGTPGVITVSEVGTPTPKERPLITRFCVKFFRRMLIWIVSLSVAFFVPVVSCGVPFPLVTWEVSVISNHKFSEVFLAVVAMVVLSASDLVDNIVATKTYLDPITRGGAWVLLTLYFIFIVYGMAEYGKGSEEVTQISAPWGAFISLLVAGVLGEFLIASTPD